MKQQRQRLLAKVWAAVSQSLIFNVLSGIFGGTADWLFRRTHGWTSKFLSRPPAAPRLSVLDRRCNRVRLQFHPTKSSAFNKDVYEVQHAKAGSDGWASDPDTDQEGRVVAPLEQDTEYDFRVRARNAKGVSAWSEAVSARTLLRPVSGGASLSNYTWTQSGIEVSISLPIPPTAKASDIHVELRPQFLKVACRQGGGAVVLVEGSLPQRVRSLTPGGTSYWEIDRDEGACRVNVILEKERPARNIKFEFWRSAFDGHPQIDTHYIDSDPHVERPRPGFNMQQVDGSVLDASSGSVRMRAKDPFDLSSLPINMQKLYKQ